MKGTSRTLILVEWAWEADLPVNYYGNVPHYLMSEEGRNMMT